MPQGLATIGQLVTFMALATMLIGKLVEIVNFINGLFLQAPKLAEFFRVLDTAPSVADRPGAQDPGRLKGHVDLRSCDLRLCRRQARRR